MPTRRTMELVVITVILLHPVLAAAKTWAHKHMATNAGPTAAVADVASAVL